MIYKRIIFILIALLMIGCQNYEIKELKDDLLKLDASLKAANKKIESLEFKNNSLKKKLQSAKFEINNFKIQKTEIDEWIVSVVKNLGPCVWVVGQFERPVPLEIVKNGTPKDLISKLNQIYKNSNSPEAILLRIEGETAYVNISEDHILTQRMGASGAASYINSILYTLYSIEAIKCVDFDFEEGDHASPGTYCPGQDYKNESQEST